MPEPEVETLKRALARHTVLLDAANAHVAALTVRLGQSALEIQRLGRLLADAMEASAR